MGNLETKIRLRTLIKQRCEEDGSYYREVDPIRILIRCPFCGDIQDMHTFISFVTPVKIQMLDTSVLSAENMEL